ncbi:ABC transporter permease [Amycolatopsis sp. NPDC049868]|uniref:ABC transporter permease n=1 Tax=Amycolatopsis sp. NPDC049868 TaxID=3363934 RepID=UPI003793BFB0
MDEVPCGPSRLSVLRHELRATAVLIRASWRAAMAYRVSFWSALTGGVGFQGTQLLFLGVLLASFNNVGGWPLNDIVFVFSLRLAAHAGYVTLFGSLYSIDRAIQQGDVDRYLLRPTSVFTQVITRYAPIMALGDAVLGFGSLIAFAPGSSVTWTGAQVTYLCACLIGGALVEAGIQTFLAGLSFRLTTTESLRSLVDDTFTRFGGYPLTIFSREGLITLTFVVPMAFIAYLPATYLLERTGELPFPSWLAVASPCAGPIVFAIGLTFFNRMAKGYNSPGS